MREPMTQEDLDKICRRIAPRTLNNPGRKIEGLDVDYEFPKRKGSWIIALWTKLCSLGMGVHRA